MQITAKDIDTIKQCKTALESESIAMRLSKIAGAPVDALLGHLPKGAGEAISKAINKSLREATGWAFTTTGTKQLPILREDWVHKVAVVLTGAAGGAVGLASTLVELPISTMLMLRSIGCIAEEEGLNMRDMKTRLGCVSILAMGADPTKVEGDETGYWVTRKTMGALVTQAAEWTGAGAAPKLATFVVEIGKRFGIVITNKVAVQLAPAIGACTGAMINHFFLEHYQSVAHAHFSIERLCLKYDERSVRTAYKAA
jgi:hypothetical protein